MSKIREKFYEEAFKGCSIPEKIKEASERICERFNIRGICDPMYICNVIAVESGSGDGMGNFSSDDIVNKNSIARRLRHAYACNIERTEVKELEELLG